jgi:hypothetical protein
VRDQKQLEFEIAGQPSGVAELDLVVPFTTPDLTRVALDAASRMGAGLDAAVRLVRVQVVPIQLNPEQSPVYLDFLKTQLDQFQSPLPLTGEIRLARDFERGLTSALRQSSVVILATKRRPWRTRTERLARSLRRSGYKVIVVSEEVRNA